MGYLGTAPTLHAGCLPPPSTYLTYYLIKYLLVVTSNKPTKPTFYIYIYASIDYKAHALMKVYG